MAEVYNRLLVVCQSVVQRKVVGDNQIGPLGDLRDARVREAKLAEVPMLAKLLRGAACLIELWDQPLEKCGASTAWSFREVPQKIADLREDRRSRGRRLEVSPETIKKFEVLFGECHWCA